MMYSGLRTYNDTKNSSHYASLSPHHQLRKTKTRRGVRGGGRRHNNKSPSKGYSFPQQKKKPRFAEKYGAFEPCMTPNGFALRSASPVTILKRPATIVELPQQQQERRPRRSTKASSRQGGIVPCTIQFQSNQRSNSDNVSVISSRPSKSSKVEGSCCGSFPNSSITVRPYKVATSNKRTVCSPPTCFIEIDDTRDGEPWIFCVSLQGRASQEVVDLNDTEVIDFCQAVLDYSNNDRKNASWIFGLSQVSTGCKDFNVPPKLILTYLELFVQCARSIAACVEENNAANDDGDASHHHPRKPWQVGWQFDDDGSDDSAATASTTSTSHHSAHHHGKPCQSGWQFDKNDQQQTSNDDDDDLDHMSLWSFEM